jgi:hypothetical protein
MPLTSLNLNNYASGEKYFLPLRYLDLNNVNVKTVQYLLRENKLNVLLNAPAL